MVGSLHQKLSRFEKYIGPDKVTISFIPLKIPYAKYAKYKFNLKISKFKES